MTKAIGARRWAIAGGHIPVESHGPEPAFTSRDQLSILNTGADGASLAITVFHPDRDPVGPYEITVPARRVRRIRVNDLIFPEAVELGRPYALVIESDRPLVIQFTRFDSSGSGARLGSIAADL
ncbi:MAG: sensory rhodopsin transducer [Bauldia sp.]